MSFSVTKLKSPHCGVSLAIPGQPAALNVCHFVFIIKSPNLMSAKCPSTSDWSQLHLNNIGSDFNLTIQDKSAKL